MAGSRNRSKGAPLSDLPGPERVFLLGNLKNFPRGSWVTTFAKWREQLGDIVYLKLPHRQILVLSSLEDAEELLLKRSNLWSHRAPNRVVNDLMGFGWSLLQSQPDHQNWIEQRKMLRKVLGPQVIKDYDKLIESEAEDFVNRLEGFSGDPTELVFESIGAVIIKLAYGSKVYKEHGHELVKLNTESIDLMAWSFQQLWLPNILPIARFLPSWVPGIQFPKYAKEGQRLFGGVRQKAFDIVQKNLDEGTADFSVLSHYLNAPEVSTPHLRDATAIMYMGGVDTTGSAVLNLMAHMALHPDIQTKAQAEIDQKLGRGGTITNAEIQSLDYLNAVWKETLRFSPPATTVVRCNVADDVWKGYFMPKGTLVIPNVPFMLRDPRIWGDDANLFNPGRFLPEYNPRASELPDIETPVFGFGRRICPGRYMAERNGIMFAARMLQAYEIRPEDTSKPFSVTFDDGLLQRPKDLRCRFVPR
ncbi:cytochrome P450 [Serendipita vermifera]|nr:cytochrome P450 [Serendipita vermifera]